jgi:acyl carrier protein
MHKRYGQWALDKLSNKKMGLDSVEILVRVEKHLDISISDREAEKILTVQDFADCAFNKVTVNPTENCKSQMLFYKLRNYFTDKGIAKEHVQRDTKIRDLITEDLKDTWADIEKYLKLDLPTLSDLDFNPTKEKEIKMLGLKFWTRKSPVTVGTIGDLVNWTLAKNYDTLINPKSLFDKGDVEKIIIGIISDSMGIPVDEIKLEHKISYDLGVD